MKLKKYKVPLIIISVLALVVGTTAAVISGYKLFTAVSHFDVVEGVEVQYWSGTGWLPLNVSGGTFDLGIATIKPGETNSFTLKAINNAPNGVIGLQLNIESIDGITHDVLCNGNSNGLQYTKAAEFLFKLPADSVWRSVDITTTASGDIWVGSIEFDNTLTRSNPESSYALTCLT